MRSIRRRGRPARGLHRERNLRCGNRALCRRWRKMDPNHRSRSQAASAGRASRTGPQSHRRAQQQRPIRDHQRPSALSDPAKTIPRQSRGSIKSPIDRQPLIAFPRVRSSEAFRRRPLYRGRSLAPGRHPKPLPKSRRSPRGRNRPRVCRFSDL